MKQKTIKNSKKIKKVRDSLGKYYVPEDWNLVMFHCFFKQAKRGIYDDKMGNLLQIAYLVNISKFSFRNNHQNFAYKT